MGICHCVPIPIIGICHLVLSLQGYEIKESHELIWKIKTVQKEKENSEPTEDCCRECTGASGSRTGEPTSGEITIEDEKEQLGSLLEQDRKLSPEMQETIRKRLDMLNSRLAMEITDNESYAIPYKNGLSR